MKDLATLDKEPVLVTGLSTPSFFAAPLQTAASFSSQFSGIPFPRNSVRIPSGEQNVALPATMEEYLAGSFPPMVVQDIETPPSWKQLLLAQFSRTLISTAEESTLSISLP